MEMSIVAGFWVVSFLLIMTPGADWAYAISAGINGRRVVPAVMGLMSGHLLATLVVVAGVGVLIAQHPLALSGLTIAGRFICCGSASRCYAILLRRKAPCSMQETGNSGR